MSEQSKKYHITNTARCALTFDGAVEIDVTLFGVEITDEPPKEGELPPIAKFGEARITLYKTDLVRYLSESLGPKTEEQGVRLGDEEPVMLRVVTGEPGFLENLVGQELMRIAQLRAQAQRPEPSRIIKPGLSIVKH